MSWLNEIDVDGLVDLEDKRAATYTLEGDCLVCLEELTCQITDVHSCHRCNKQFHMECVNGTYTVSECPSCRASWSSVPWVRKASTLKLSMRQHIHTTYVPPYQEAVVGEEIFIHHIRGFMVRWKFLRQKRAAIVIQKIFRGYQERIDRIDKIALISHRLEMIRNKSASIIALAFRRRNVKANCAARLIQKEWAKVALNLKIRYEAATKIQSLAKGFFERSTQIAQRRRDNINFVVKLNPHYERGITEDYIPNYFLPSIYHCQNGHHLSRSNPIKDNYCDICENELLQNTTVFTCRICDHDVCLNCRNRPYNNFRQLRCIRNRLKRIQIREKNLYNKRVIMLQALARCWLARRHTWRSWSSRQNTSRLVFWRGNVPSYRKAFSARDRDIAARKIQRIYNNFIEKYQEKLDMIDDTTIIIEKLMEQNKNLMRIAVAECLELQSSVDIFSPEVTRLLTQKRIVHLHNILSLINTIIRKENFMPHSLIKTLASQIKKEKTYNIKKKKTYNIILKFEHETSRDSEREYQICSDYIASQLQEFNKVSKYNRDRTED